MDITNAVLNAIAQMPIVIVLIFVMLSQTKAHQSSIEYYRAQHEAMLKWVLFHADNHLQFTQQLTKAEGGAITPEV